MMSDAATSTRSEGDAHSLFDSRVAIRHLRTPEYPAFPYLPTSRYPEFEPEFETSEVAADGPANETYAAVRHVLADLALDEANVGTAMWNPLRQYIGRGQRALIKPNWVLHANHRDGSLESLITHTSVIRPVLDYIIHAMQGFGTVDIADAPLQGCELSVLLRRANVEALVAGYRERFPDVTFNILDLRKTTLKRAGSQLTRRESQSFQDGDPRGYSLVDLGQASVLKDIQHNAKRFRVTMYDHRLMQAHHNERKHEYLVSNSVLGADLIVNLPKLKCHMKAGITGALKNLVGINGHKEYLPHHTNGSPADGGDQYSRSSRIKPWLNRLEDNYWAHLTERGTLHNVVQSLGRRCLRRIHTSLGGDPGHDGSWSGNDTIPRTVLDLNHILYYYDAAAQALAMQPQRHVLHIVDGIVAGQGEGPLSPSPKSAGVVLGGWNPLAVDLCGAQLIGIDPRCVSLLKHGLEHPASKLALDSIEAIRVTENGERQSPEQIPNLDFELPAGWRDAAAR